ncbi:MAG: amino acid permease [Ardenticatenaceae bacterium]
MEKKTSKLKKSLGLFDVVAISTGAMFSSGFFLLPGLAAAQTGASVIFAYLVACFLILPAMFSMSELSTAMPKAGGAYYFIDRSMGPLAGTVGGLGIYAILVLKTAFALIGIGAYTVLIMDLPIKEVAVTLTIVFMILNILGTKETAILQRILVVVLIAILGFFIVQGLYETSKVGLTNIVGEDSPPFFTFGWEGFFSTIGFVFISYIGLTKVASVAEEVQNPDRNLPLGMIISLLITVTIYGLGVFIIVAFLPPTELYASLTPVADTVNSFSGSIPVQASLFLIVAAAFASFASTGNAGLLSASRYPLAMARDQLLPAKFLDLGRFQTPVFSVVLTSGLIIGTILFVEAATIAKLASAFQLFVFVLINFAVIIMRESRIPSYGPGYYSPLYPWMQIFGMMTSFGLIIMMGTAAMAVTVVIVLLGIGWYSYYVQSHVLRQGAILHWFAHLGKERYQPLAGELLTILREKGLRDSDPFDEIIANASTVDLDDEVKTFEEALSIITPSLAERLSLPADELESGLLQASHIGATPIERGLALPHLQLFNLPGPEMALVRSQTGIKMQLEDMHHDEEEMLVYGLIILIGPEAEPKQYLRILAQVAERVDQTEFIQDWLAAPNEKALKETLLSGKRFFSLQLKEGSPSAWLIGKSLAELEMPEDALVLLIRRGQETIIPHGHTVFQPDDEVTMIGYSTHTFS